MYCASKLVRKLMCSIILKLMWKYSLFFQGSDLIFLWFSCELLPQGGGSSIYLVMQVCFMTGLLFEERFPEWGSTFARLSLKQGTFVNIPASPLKQGLFSTWRNWKLLSEKWHFWTRHIFKFVSKKWTKCGKNGTFLPNIP